MPDTLDRIGGGVLAAGATLTTIGYILGSIDESGPQVTPAYVNSPVYVLYNLLLFFGGALVLVGLPSLVASHWGRGRALTLAGAVGFGLVTVIQGVGNAFVDVGLFPVLVDNAATRALANGPAPAMMGALFAVGMVGWIVGGPLLGIGVLRAGVVHRWIGVLMLVGWLLGLVSLVLPQQFNSLGAIIAGVAIAAVGIDLAVPARARSAAPAVASVA